MDSGSLIINGNAMHLGLADESVHCVITSPPYYGLRDYLTGQWVGGDEACEHDTMSARNGREGSGANGKQIVGAFPSEFSANACLKCGAIRVDQQLGLEAISDCLGWATGNACGECYVCHTVQWAREVWRVLRKDGTFWLNLGDSHVSNPAKGGSGTPNGSNGRGENYARKHRAKKGEGQQRGAKLKSKDLYGIPWSVAFALREDGWYLRLGNIWAKGVSGQDSIRENAYEAAKREGLSDTAAQRIADAVDPYVGNCMPESVRDRCTKSHEDVFLFSKTPRYYFDYFAIRERQTESSRERANYKWSGRTDDHSNGARTGSSFQRVKESGELIKTIPEDGYRNRRSVWTINTQGFEGEHYAAFPPKLVEPCVMAGTSEKGCCPKCGSQWVRVLRETNKVAASHKGSLFDNGKTGARDGGERTQKGERYESQFVGWQPSCECGEMNTMPCTVLDPFSGTGTVGLVCAKLKRSYIGNELNHDYIKISQKRIADARFEFAMKRRQHVLFEDADLIEEACNRILK